MSDELKSCPFCGSSNLQHERRAHSFVECLDCGCDGPLRPHMSASKDAWNTRAQPSDGDLTNEGAEPVLSKPAKVGSVRFGKGIKERLVIEAAQRQFEHSTQLEVEQARLERLRASMAAVHAQDCTCPSGDGSLRWPCPVHPPEVKNARLEMPDARTEPVAWADPKAFKNFKAGVATHEWMWAFSDGGLVPLYLRAPTQASLVLPVRAIAYGNRLQEWHTTGWNACLDRVKELNS